MTDSKPMDVLQPSTAVPGEVRVADPQVEVYKKYDEAARLGIEIFRVNKVRLDNRFTFALNQERFAKSHVSALAPKRPEDIVSEEDIKMARRGSFGIALEAARQICDGDVLRQRQDAKDDTGNLDALRKAIIGGKKLGDEMITQDQQGMMEVAKGIVAVQLKKQASEVTLTDLQLQGWIQEKFVGAQSRLGKQLETLKAYFR